MTRPSTIKPPMIRLPRLRFRSLKSKLAVLYAGMFAAIMVAVAIVGQAMITSHAQDTVRGEMMASGQVYDRLWALRAKSLASAAEITARDFGFRTAVATGDAPTIASALDSVRARVGVAKALVVTSEGGFTGDAGALAPVLARAANNYADGQREAVVATSDGIYRLVTAPIMAPTEIGRVVFGVRLDATELDALRKLASIPLTATMLRRDTNGRWVAADGSIAASDPLDALVKAGGGPRRLDTLRLPDGESFALAKQLKGPGGTDQAAILVSYPISAAMAPYLPLQLGIMLVALAGLAIVVVGSRSLARGIARPLAALSAAARSLEEGTRAEVRVIDDDEIGELSATFNRMSAGIIERENRISHLAFHDVLTGLPNRALFRQQLDQALVRAPRTGESIAVLCLDLDGFKGVNDALGHPIGDGLLRGMAAILTELAPEAIVSRLGGDEFAIILAFKAPSDRPRALAQAISNRLGEPVGAGEHKVATSTSIGIAVSPDDGIDADTLLKNADLALYRAKVDGRSCFRFFEPALDAAARRRHQIELDLREALQLGQLHLNFQPIYDLKTDSVSGFEALLRWQHPERGLVPPVEFIPVAEETGLIYSIGEWVLREACRQAAGWPGSVRVAVNVSPLQFRNPGFSAMIMQALAVSALDPNRLEIEITESVFLEGEAPVLELLHKLRNLGIRVALDDFGTGYSSLSYLRSFPFDKIKIDRSFITPVADDASAAAIVRAIVDLASALNMETTAEGVEDDNQLTRLRGQGCGSIQGYFFSRPVAADMVLGLITKQQLAA